MTGVSQRAELFFGTSIAVNEVIDITRLNAGLKTTVARIDQLRDDIDAIVAQIEGVAL